MSVRLKKIITNPAAKLITGTTVSQLILILSSLVLTRLYSPSEFGVFSVALSIVLLFSINGSLRYQLAIVIEENEKNVSDLVILSTFITSVKTLLFTVVILLTVSGGGLGTLYFNDTLNNLFYIFLFFMISLNQILYQLGLRQKDYVSISRSKIVEAFGTSSSQIILYSFDVIGLIIGRAIGTTFTTVALVRNGIRQKRVANYVWSIRNVKHVGRRYKDFPIFSAPAAFLNVASARLPAIYVAFAFGPASAGLFVIGQRLLSTPISVVGVAISDLIFNASVEAKRQKKLMAFTARVLLSVSACTIPLSVILYFMIPYLFDIFLPREWSAAADIAQYLSPMMATQFIVTSISKILISVEKQKLSFFIQCSMTLAKVGPFFISWWMNFSLLDTVLLYSAAGTITNFFAIGLTYRSTVSTV